MKLTGRYGARDKNVVDRWVRPEGKAGTIIEVCTSHYKAQMRVQKLNTEYNRMRLRRGALNSFWFQK